MSDLRASAEVPQETSRGIARSGHSRRGHSRDSQVFTFSCGREQTTSQSGRSSCCGPCDSIFRMVWPFVDIDGIRQGGLTSDSAGRRSSLSCLEWAFAVDG